MTVYEEVARERSKQDAKWGIQDHSMMTWIVIATEELGEASASVLQKKDEDYRHEMIQVAAVAIAAVEAYDRMFSERQENKGKANEPTPEELWWDQPAGG